MQFKTQHKLTGLSFILYTNFHRHLILAYTHLPHTDIKVGTWKPRTQRHFQRLQLAFSSFQFPIHTHTRAFTSHHRLRGDNKTEKEQKPFRRLENVPLRIAAERAHRRNKNIFTSMLLPPYCVAAGKWGDAESQCCQ